MVQPVSLVPTYLECSVLQTHIICFRDPNIGMRRFGKLRLFGADFTNRNLYALVEVLPTNPALSNFLNELNNSIDIVENDLFHSISNLFSIDAYHILDKTRHSYFQVIEYSAIFELSVILELGNTCYVFALPSKERWT